MMVSAWVTALPKNGSGHGLALHTTMMAVIGGEITVDSHQDEYTQVLLTYK